MIPPEPRKLPIYDRLPRSVQVWLDDAVIRQDGWELVVGTTTASYLALGHAPLRNRKTLLRLIRFWLARAWLYRASVPKNWSYGNTIRVVVITTLAEILGVCRGVSLADGLALARERGPCRPGPPPDEVLRILFEHGRPGSLGDPRPRRRDINTACRVAEAARLSAPSGDGPGRPLDGPTAADPDLGQ